MVGLYRSDGEWVAVYERGHIFSREREWLGFVVGRDVFDPQGIYIGYLSDDRRLLCARHKRRRARQRPPQRPKCPRLPATMPLAPLLSSLPFHTIDVFEEYPERFLYVSDTRPDLE